MGEVRLHTILDVIESAFDQDLGPDLIVQMASLPHAKLSKFYEMYRGYTFQARNLVQPDPVGLRPYIPVARLHERLRRGILGGTDKSFDDLEAVNESVGALHRVLLYCHSVALLNPLVYITDFIRTGYADDWVRNRLANYLSWVNYVRPLIESGALLLLEDEEATIVGHGELPNSRDLAERYIEEADFSDLVELPHAEAKAYVKNNVSLATIALRRAIENVSHEWSVAEDHGFSLDYFLPTRIYLTALSAFVASRHPHEASQQTAVLKERLDAMRLMTLLQLDLPDFEFSERDLILVREGDQFVQWRADLSSALDHINTLGDKDLLEPKGGLRIVREELIARKRELEKNVGRSKYLSDARAGNTTFIAGAIAAIALSHWFGPASGLASLTLSTALERAWAFRKSKLNNSDTALLNHYVLFTAMH